MSAFDDLERQLLASVGRRHAFQPAHPSREMATRIGAAITTTLRRRSKRLAMVGVAALAVAVAGLVLGITGGGPPNAFAGWSATPTPPVSGQLQAAESACGSYPRLGLGSLTPTVADTRGPFSLLLYSGVPNSTIGSTILCITGLPGRPSGGGSVSGVGAPQAVPVASGVLKPEGDSVSYAAGQAQYHVLVGQVGAGVTAATLVLDDGSSVETTITNGWFAAWWPGGQGVRSATITTTSGTTTEPLNTRSFGANGLPTQPATSSTGSTGPSSTATETTAAS